MASNKVLLSLQHHMIHKWNLKPVAMQFLNLNLKLSEWTKANMQHNKRSCHNHHLIYLNSCKKTHTIKFCRFRKQSWALAISAWHHLKPSCKQSQWKQHQTFGLRTHTHINSNHWQKKPDSLLPKPIEFKFPAIIKRRNEHLALPSMITSTA